MPRYGTAAERDSRRRREEKWPVRSAAVRGRLRLTLDPWFARIVLAPRLPELTTRYPELGSSWSATIAST